MKFYVVSLFTNTKSLRNGLKLIITKKENFYEKTKHGNNLMKKHVLQTILIKGNCSFFY